MVFETVVKSLSDPCPIKAPFVVVPMELYKVVSTKALVLYLRATCLGGLRSYGYFESQSKIAAYLGISERSVRSLINELEDAGAIYKDGYSGRGGFQGTRVLRCRKIEGDFQTIPTSFLELLRSGIDCRRVRLSIYLAKRVRGSQAIVTRCQIAQETKISKNEITRLLVEVMESGWVTIQVIGRRLLIKPGTVMNTLHSKAENPCESGFSLGADPESRSPSSSAEPPSGFPSSSLDFPVDLPETSHYSKPLYPEPFDSEPLHSDIEGSGLGPPLDPISEENKRLVQRVADLCHRSIPHEWWSEHVDPRWHATGHPKTTAAVTTALHGCQVTSEEINNRVFLPLSIWIRLNGCAKDVQTMKTPGLIASVISRFHHAGAVMSEAHLQCPVFWHESISFSREYTTIGDCLDGFLDEEELLHDAHDDFGSARPEWLANAVLETRAAYEEGVVHPDDDDWHDLMGHPFDEDEDDEVLPLAA